MRDWERDFADFVAARGAAITRYAYLVCGDATAASDLAQEGLLRAFSRLRGGRDVDNTEAFVRRTILNLHVDEWRRRKRWRATSHLLANRELNRPAEDTVATADLVRTALASLSPRQRVCVVLRFYNDLSIPQIANELGCSEGTVKRHLSDAMTRLGTDSHIAQEGSVQ